MKEPNNATNIGARNDRIFSGVIQTIIAGGIIWLATEVNKIDATVAAMQERTKAMEDIRPAMNQMQSNQEEIKIRLIRVEDNQLRNLNYSNKK